jgi:uncharacterized protein (TIGR02646 family)
MSAEHIPVTLQRRVRLRASDRCEYCRLSQAMQEATFHVDHVKPRSANGPTVFENLALACVSCSLRKGAQMVGVDPRTGQQTRLFDPRVDDWNATFEVTPTCEIAGRTPSARATIELLQLNRVVAIAIRVEERRRTRWP